MLLYNLRLGWQSLLRTPLLSLLTLGAIGLGIAVATTFVTTYYLLSKDPLPHKSDDLRYVRLDAWDPDRSWDDDHPERPPNQVTYRDAVALMESDLPRYRTAMYMSRLFVHPENTGVAESERPFRATVRLALRDFFPMFEVPFAHGGPWSESADDGPEAVVVLDHGLNQRLFGGADSVGRELRIDQRTFTVVGVLEPWRPPVKFYDVHHGSQNLPEQLYLPFRLGREMRIETDGNTSSWDDYEGFEGRLESEAIWLQFWAELPTEAEVEAFQSFVDAYALEQRRLGRFQRPINNQLQPMMEWLEEEGAVPPSARSLMLISLLFLGVCSINLIGLLLAKFLARSPEIGVRRALGASRWAIFVQHLVECQLIGVLGGGLGVALSAGALELLNRQLGGGVSYHLDLNMVAAGIALALVSGLVAGLYPAWRVCSVAPAAHLKLQ